MILLVLLFSPLMFLPHLVTRVARIDGSRPFLLGMRQAFDKDRGPRLEGRDAPVARFRTGQRLSLTMAAVGAVVFVFSVTKGVHDASSQHASLPQIAYTKLVDPAISPPDAVRVMDIVADMSSQWAYDYSVRRDNHHDVYYQLRPVSGRADAAVSLVELDETSPQYDPAPWNVVNAPGAREGLPSVLGDWEAGELRGLACSWIIA